MSRDPATPATSATAVTLGLLAGGAATRLGGRDKAWLERGGVPQVLRLRRRFEGCVAAVLVSANVGQARYRAEGMDVVGDEVTGAGPMAGLAALSGAASTPWLLTLPVDVVDCNDCLLPTLRSAAGDVGAWIEDAQGMQPLVALWRVDRLRDGAAQALREGTLSVQALQARLEMPRVRLAGVHLGNLNTPRDLARAGVA